MAPRRTIWDELDELQSLGTLDGLRRLGAVIGQKWSRNAHLFEICRVRAPRHYVRMRRAG